VLLPEHGSPCNLGRPETVLEVALALGVEEKEDLILGAGKRTKQTILASFQLFRSMHDDDRGPKELT
jgi:hypothetical protein